MCRNIRRVALIKLHILYHKILITPIYNNLTPDIILTITHHTLIVSTNYILY